MHDSIEIAAPVATLEMCMAAVHSGADSIYVGFPGFNARAKTKVLSVEELGEIIEYCHLYGVKVAVCLNIVIFEDELEKLISPLIEVLSLSPDSLVVQDVGVARLIKFISPSQKVSASTQMTVTDSGAITALKDLGLERFILGREVSITEIKEIRSSPGKELEVFAHGALCISYSGQCLSSGAHGGRSANRGQCAQSCRLKYELFINGKNHADSGYFLSPHDLCALEKVGELKKAGINALKIEGRMKTPEYVGSVVRAFRYAADNKFAAGDCDKTRRELGFIFSRGFCSGFLEGVNHQSLVDGGTSGHIGVKAGYLEKTENNSVYVKADFVPQAGDGALFVDVENDLKVGGNIYAVSEERSTNNLVLKFARDFPFEKLKRGMTFYINSSPSFENEARRSWNERESLKRIPVKAFVYGRQGAKLSITLKDPDRNSVQRESESELVSANKKSASLTEKVISDELGKQGAGPFTLTDCRFDIPPGLFVNSREIKKIRQHLTDELISKRKSVCPAELKTEKETLKWLPSRSGKSDASLHKAEINLLIRSHSLFSSLKGLAVNSVCLDFENPELLKEGIVTVKDFGFRAGIATPRISREGDQNILDMIKNASSDFVLVRSLGALDYFLSRGREVHCDFSLNITNHLSAEWFLDKGAKKLCRSFDLDREQLNHLLTATDPERIEVPVYFHSPLFHTEHCLFAANLSSGRDWRDCGRSCEKNDLRLKDPYNTVHIVKADSCCRNTLFGEKALSRVSLIPELLNSGVRNFRIEEATESREALETIINDCHNSCNHLIFKD